MLQGALDTDRFVEHASMAIFVFPTGAVYETVAQDVVIYTEISPHSVRSWTRKPLHIALRGWALWNTRQVAVSCFMVTQTGHKDLFVKVN